jgi:hypothetical protein
LFFSYDCVKIEKKQSFLPFKTQETGLKKGNDWTFPFGIRCCYWFINEQFQIRHNKQQNRESMELPP